ncbi:MAG: uncharacterized protein KVP18_002472 [Porospora cf. gigantea A]|uniref:uncharacterized protein n=1 Tax=Porospora cf. gigantea A TaxID=2853593 RepID=UPI00355A03C2|nr:MAG: hypothetical protein KVP18_002472 [Porospora cf. gigantea A]
MFGRNVQSEQLLPVRDTLQPSGGTGESPDVIPASSMSGANTVIWLVGFSEGLTHLASLAIYYLFKDDLKFTPAVVSLVFVVPAVAWFLKPTFAFLTDAVPIFGMRRKPYLMMFSLLQSVGYFLLADYATGVVSSILILGLIAVSATFCSSVAEALLVENSTGNRSAVTAVADFLSAKAVGSLLVAYLSGALLETVSKKVVFWFTAMFPVLITVGAAMLTDESTTPYESSSLQFRALLDFLQRPVIWGPALYILAYMSGPDYDDTFFFYLTNQLKFPPSFMGTLRFTYGIAAIMGIVLYRTILYKISYRTLLSTSIIVSLPLYLSPVLLVDHINRAWGIPDTVFVLSGGFLNEAVAELQLLPLLVIGAEICPPGLEGSVYAALISVRNLGMACAKLSSSIGAWYFHVTATDFTYLAEFIIVCGVFNLVPLPFTFLVPSQADLKTLKAEEKLVTERVVIQSEAEDI